MDAKRGYFELRADDPRTRFGKVVPDGRYRVNGHELVYYHGKSVKEVAEIVGISEATVKTRMFYARKKLAELVETA
jgi:hypothetical protein